MKVHYWMLKTTKMKYTLLAIGIMLCLNVKGQESEIENSGGKHKIALVFGVTHIPAAIEAGEKTSEEFVPTLGLDYFYQFESGWKLGMVLDYEFAEYIVKFDQEDLTRDSVLVTGILVGYEFAERWSFMAGPGVEFEKKDIN